MPHTGLIDNTFNYIGSDIGVYDHWTGICYRVRPSDPPASLNDIQPNQQISCNVLDSSILDLPADGFIVFPDDWEITVVPDGALGGGYDPNPPVGYKMKIIPAHTPFNWSVIFTLPSILRLIEGPHNVTIGDPQGFMAKYGRDLVEK